MSPGTFERLNAVLGGRYAIERELARGGMATVYLAHDVRHSRNVALKLLNSDLSHAVGADRFEREIGIAARLSHPYIVALYDSGAVDGQLFYVMPYVRGESLRQRLDRDRQLAVDEALRIVTQVATALDYAHAQQLVHRDIKPENILLHEGAAMLADFGVAVAATADGADRLTATGISLGTPHYMSPEQAAGETNLDARSDLYSLACVLYELLAGEPPFTGPTAQSVIAKRFTTAAPSVSARRPAVPAAVDRAIARALSRDPAQRFASCGEFVAALAAPAGAEDRPAPSVAVLPFQNFSADPENEFFADGITEDVIAQLSKIRSLKVISRTSVMPFRKREQSLREIGRILGVGTLLEGSVRRAGDRVRIVAQLIDAESDRHLWAETYDRQLTDIFAIQTDVALQIASALEAELSPAERNRIHREPTTSFEAYQLYMQGRYWHIRFTDEGFRKCLEYFRRASEIDPRFALAHVGVALAYSEAVVLGGGTLAPEEALGRARDAAMHALEIDPELGEAHATLGLLSFAHDYDWVGAEAHFRRALELSPNGADIHDYYSWMLGALERYDDAILHARRAQELDPLAHRVDLSSMLLRAGRYEEALETAKLAVELEPRYNRAHATVGWAYLKLGRIAEGLAALEHAVSLDPDSSLFIGQLGEAHAMYGQPERARAILADLEGRAHGQFVSPYHFAYVCTGLGEHDRAIDYLEQAFASRTGSVYGIKGSFLFTPLRDHPRFKALLARMKLA